MIRLFSCNMKFWFSLLQESRHIGVLMIRYSSYHTGNNLPFLLQFPVNANFIYVLKYSGFVSNTHRRLKFNVKGPLGQRAYIHRVFEIRSVETPTLKCHLELDLEQVTRKHFSLGLRASQTTLRIQWNMDPLLRTMTSPVTQTVKNLPAMGETQVQSLGQEDPLQRATATHSTNLAWRIPWIEEPGKLQPLGSQRVRHDWVTNSFTFIFLRTIYTQTQHPAKLGFTNSLTPIYGPSWSSSTLGKECLMA